MQLTAVVIGSGWAGEGHTLALRAAGVKVVALCGRSPEPARALAQRLDIPQVRFDWQGSLAEFQPDIVAIATPAVPHREMAEVAANQGCHVFCDKPLAVNAAEARAMLAAVRRAGVKHAYGPATCLAPAICHARDLLADGLIGTLTSIECSQHSGLSRPFVYSWFYEVSEGGGLLNNLFTHKLAQVLHLSGGTPKRVIGEAQCFIPRAPMGPAIHDFRELFHLSPDVDEADPSRWRSVEADTAHWAMVQLALPRGADVTARFYGSLTSRSRTGDTITLYGTKGTSVLEGASNSPEEVRHYDFERDSWRQLTVAPPDTGAAPPVEDGLQRDWNALLRQFAADIRGEPHSFYPTFEDGWLAAEIIEVIRAGPAWSDVPGPA